MGDSWKHFIGKGVSNAADGSSGVEVNGDTAGMGARWGDREWVKIVENAYWQTGDISTGSLTDSANGLLVEKAASIVMAELCGGTDGRAEALRTQYRAVESEIVGLAVKW